MSIQILSYSDDGTMNVQIKDKEYIYFLDAGWIPSILKKARHSTGKALTLLKLKSRDYEEIKNV